MSSKLKIKFPERLKSRKLTKTQKAWLAAVIDCDGCITIHKPTPSNKSQYYTRVIVGMSNREIVDEMLKITGIGHTWVATKSFKLFDGRKKDIYNWAVSHITANWFLRQIKDFLLIKKKQADIGIALQDRINAEDRYKKGKWGAVKLTKKELEKRKKLYLELKELKKRPFVEVR